MFRSRRIALSFALVAYLLIVDCAAAAPTFSYKVVARYPHSTDSYTEGFFYLDGLFYEGVGIAGRSGLLAIEPETGKPVQKHAMAPEYFGEGIVDWGPNIYQWTWQSHICFVYDRFSLRTVKQFGYTGEGWGMTRTAKEIITSDGSATLRFRDPATFRRNSSHRGEGWDEDYRPAQRAGVHQGRDLCQRLALGRDRAISVPRTDT